MTPRPRAKSRTATETRIRAHMSRKGIATYKQLAALSGVHQSTIQRICSGVTKPTIDTAKSLAKVLDVTVDELI